MSAMAYAVLLRQTLEHFARAAGTLFAWVRKHGGSPREDIAVVGPVLRYAWPPRHPAEMALLHQRALAHTPRLGRHGQH